MLQNIFSCICSTLCLGHINCAKAYKPFYQAKKICRMLWSDSEPILSHASSLVAGLQHHSSDKTQGIELNLGPSQGPQQHVEGVLRVPLSDSRVSSVLRLPPLDQIIWDHLIELFDINHQFHISLSPRFFLSLHPSLSISSPERSPYSALSCMLSTFPLSAIQQLISIQQK